MKKRIIALTLGFAIVVSGCGIEEEKVTQESPIMEEVETEVTTEVQEEEEQNQVSSYDDYIASIIAQSDVIKTSLEQDALTQADMNLKSQELYELWDDALNYLWGELKSSLPEEEFSELLDVQRIWITEKEEAVEEAGKEVEGGSLYPLVVNMEAAKITEERVLELYELLK